MSHTYVVLDISPAAYNEIKRKLVAAGYDHTFHEDVIDMHGIAVKAQPPYSYRNAVEQFRFAEQWTDAHRRAAVEVGCRIIHDEFLFETPEQFDKYTKLVDTYLAGKTSPAGGG